MSKAKAQQLDLFVLPLGDMDLRDQQDTMESPFFALSKGRKTPIAYVHPKGTIKVDVSPNVKYSVATIWDADILIWAAGVINRQGDKEGLAELDRTRSLHFHPVDLLRAIRRNTGGKDIKELRAALERLATTYVKTTVREHHQGRGKEAGFSWIDSWAEITTTRADGSEQTQGFSLTLSNWFYMGIVHQKLLLSIEPEYFDLTGGYERWLYRVARKHAHGTPQGWTFTLGTLHQKSGSDATKRKFKAGLKRIADNGGILGYGIDWQERGPREDPLIRIYPLADYARNQQLAASHERAATVKAANATLRAEPHRFRELADPATLARIVARYPNINLEEMLSRFIAWNAGKEPPRNFGRAFEGFLAKHDRGKRP